MRILGTDKMSRDLTELNKLEEYLKTKGIKYVREDKDNSFTVDTWETIKKIMGSNACEMDLHQITVYENDDYSWDVICQYGSYGAKEGLLEGMGSIFDDNVEGWLTAADVIKKIEEAKQ